MTAESKEGTKMKLCKLFKKQYDAIMLDPMAVESIKKAKINGQPVVLGSYEAVHLVWKYLWGANTTDNLIASGITQEVISSACTAKYIVYEPNIGALKKSGYRLSLKGLKALYKAYAGQWVI
jgi:hypothetical protein